MTVHQQSPATKKSSLLSRQLPADIAGALTKSLEGHHQPIERLQLGKGKS
jgi:hypothetical protein